MKNDLNNASLAIDGNFIPGMSGLMDSIGSTSIYIRAENGAEHEIVKITEPENGDLVQIEYYTPNLENKDSD